LTIQSNANDAANSKSDFGKTRNIEQTKSPKGQNDDKP